MIGMCTLLIFKICAGSASHQRGSGISFFIIYNKLIYSFNAFVCVIISSFHKLSAWYATLYKNSFPDIITTDLSIYTQSWPSLSLLSLNTDQCPKRYAILDIENYTFGSNRFYLFIIYDIFTRKIVSWL